MCFVTRPHHLISLELGLRTWSQLNLPNLISRFCPVRSPVMLVVSPLHKQSSAFLFFSKRKTKTRIYLFSFFWFCFFFFFFVILAIFVIFLSSNFLQYMEVPRLGVKLELEPPVYTIATAVRDPSRICDLHHSSQQHWILNSLSKARARTHIFMDTSQAHYGWAMMGIPVNFLWTERLG